MRQWREDNALIGFVGALSVVNAQHGTYAHVGVGKRRNALSQYRNSSDGTRSRMTAFRISSSLITGTSTGTSRKPNSKVRKMKRMAKSVRRGLLGSHFHAGIRQKRN